MRWCCIRGRPTSVRARTPSSPRSPPRPWGCRCLPSADRPRYRADAGCGQDLGQPADLCLGPGGEGGGRALRAEVLRRRMRAEGAIADAGGQPRLMVRDGEHHAGSTLPAAAGRAMAMPFRPRRAMTRRPRSWMRTGRAAPYAVYGYGAQMVELQVDRAPRHGQASEDHRRA